jgi:hypothetical protein
LALTLLTAFLLVKPAYPLLENVYFIDAVQGRYYAINTNGASYRVFYLDNSGNTIYITAYKWDANQSYIIFQSPINGRIYLRAESYTLSTLTTANWFKANAPLPGSVATATIKIGTSSVQSAIATVDLYGASGYITVSQSQITVSYKPTTLTATNSSTWSISRVTFTYNSTTCPTEPVLYQCNIYVYYPSNTPLSSIVSYSLKTKNDGIYDNSFTAYYSGNYYRYTYDVPTLYNPSSGNYISFPSSSSYTLTSTFYWDYFTLTVSLSSSISASTTGTQSYSKTNGVITASNGNVIAIYESLSELSFASLISTSSSMTFYLYTQPINVSLPTTRTVNKTIVLPLDTSSMVNSVQNPKPAIYIDPVSSWCSAYLINYGQTESFLVMVPPTLSVNGLALKAVYNYPVDYALPSLLKTYAKGGDMLSLFAFQGVANIINNKLVVQGNMSLSNYLGSTVILKIEANSVFTVSNANYGWINASSNSYLAVYPLNAQSMIAGNYTVGSALILYNTLTEMGYAVSVGSVSLEAWNMNLISYALGGEITGSWKYRLPIYISLSELPQTIGETGFVFRFQLPVFDWIRSGLISPALEDLMFTDPSNRPLPFYIYNVTESGYAIVYVRYTAPITSNALVVYVLLQNRNLWGSGKTFSTLSTFDKVNPRDFADDFGFSVYYSYLSYNALLLTVKNDSSLKFGKTWFDFVAVEANRVYEQHGSTIFFSKDIEGWTGGELIAYVSRQNYDDVLVYCSTTPLVSFSLSDFKADPAYYIGYKNVNFAASFRMLMYSWSLGQIVGGYQTPQKVQKSNSSTASTVPTLDLWSLFPILMVLIVLALVARFVSGARGGGRRSEGMLSQM